MKQEDSLILKNYTYQNYYKNGLPYWPDFWLVPIWAIIEIELLIWSVSSNVWFLLEGSTCSASPRTSALTSLHGYILIIWFKIVPHLSKSKQRRGGREPDQRVGSYCWILDLCDLPVFQCHVEPISPANASAHPCSHWYSLRQAQSVRYVHYVIFIFRILPVTLSLICSQ